MTLSAYRSSGGVFARSAGYVRAARVEELGFNDTVYAIAVQGDGKIVCGGEFTSYRGSTVNYIARLNVDGTLDTTFNTGVGFNNAVLALGIQSDGKIVCGGVFTTFVGVSSVGFAVLNTDGSASSLTGTYFNNAIYTISIQSDDGIICGGLFTSPSNRIARLGGAVFSVGTGFNAEVRTTSIQSDGKIICGGTFTSFAGNAYSGLARLNTDGSLDTGFIIGVGFNSGVWSSAIQSDGKIICGGAFTTYAGSVARGIVRLDTTGGIDPGFAGDFGSMPIVYDIAIQADHKIICVGQLSKGISRLNPNGVPDPAFLTSGGGFSNDPFAVALESTNKILVGGAFTKFAGITRNRIARLNVNGTLT